MEEYWSANCPKCRSKLVFTVSGASVRGEEDRALHCPYCGGRHRVYPYNYRYNSDYWLELPYELRN